MNFAQPDKRPRRKNGSFLPDPETLAERLSRHSTPEPNSGCILWLGGCSPAGYGIVWWEGRLWAAHRKSYELAKGPIPAGMQLDHLCRARCCINAAHLEVVTHAENVRRGNSGLHHRMKTHCPHGHPYDVTNTRIDAGRRRCRECEAQYARGRSRSEARP